MTYATGSGAYTDMMTAVLDFAVLDGWLEAGGVGTGWPISKGNVGGVDYTTYTQVDNDLTAGGDGLPKTQRYMRLAVAPTTGEATTDAATSTVACPNFAYSIAEWHIFSEPALCDYIHVVFRFSNGVNNDCYSHFSFGEIDKAGMTYGAAVYATTRQVTGYATIGTASTSANDADFHSINHCRDSFCGSYGWGLYGSTALNCYISPTNPPAPNGVGGWPAHDTILRNGDYVWEKASRIAVFDTNLPDNSTTGGYFPLNHFGWASTNQPFTGSICLMPIPFVLLNGEIVTSRIKWLGVFPNVRKCSLDGFTAGDEVTYGADVWKIFPQLRNTEVALLNDAGVVSSARTGFAFKKVV